MENKQGALATNLPPATNVITQDFLFKQYMSGTGKKSNKPFHMVELHDPVTLENVNFFLQPGTNVNTMGIEFRDPVRASFSMQFMYGELKPVLTAVDKIQLSR